VSFTPALLKSVKAHPQVQLSRSGRCVRPSSAPASTRQDSLPRNSVAFAAFFRKELAGVFVRLNAGVNRLPEKRADFPDVGAIGCSPACFSTTRPCVSITNVVGNAGTPPYAAITCGVAMDNRIVNSTLLSKFQHIRRRPIVFGNADDFADYCRIVFAARPVLEFPRGTEGTR